MPHDAVEGALGELRLPGRAPEGIVDRLTHAEQLEVIDQERRVEDDPPPKEVEAVQRNAHRALHLPDDAGQGPPLPDDQGEKRARTEHEGAPFGRGGDDPRPPALEGWSR